MATLANTIPLLHEKGDTCLAIIQYDVEFFLNAHHIFMLDVFFILDNLITRVLLAFLVIKHTILTLYYILSPKLFVNIILRLTSFSHN